MGDLAINKSIRMLPKTIESVERLRDSMQAASFSDAVKGSIDICDLLVNAAQEGSKILIEDKKGKQTRVLIRGLGR